MFSFPSINLPSVFPNGLPGNIVDITKLGTFADYAINKLNTEFQMGVVTYVNVKNYSCSVLFPNGRVVDNVLIRGTHGGAYSIECTFLNDYLGAHVLVADINNRRVIVDSVPVPTDNSMTSKDKETAASSKGGCVGENAKKEADGTDKSGVSPVISFTDAQKSLPNNANSQVLFEGNNPTDFLPGDKVIAADGGAVLGVLRGGLVVLKASTLSQLILGGGAHNFIKLVAREISISSDFGEINFSNSSKGHPGFSIKGGARNGEANPGGTYTSHFHMGATPENPSARFGLRVQDVDGGTYSAMTAEDTGDFSLGTSNDLSLQCSGNLNFSVGGKTEINVSGGYGVKIGGNKYEEVFGDSDFQVIGTHDKIILGKERSAIGEDKELNVSGVLKIGAGGIVISTSGNGTAGPVTLECSSLNIKKTSGGDPL